MIHHDRHHRLLAGAPALAGSVRVTPSTGWTYPYTPCVERLGNLSSPVLNDYVYTQYPQCFRSAINASPSLRVYLMCNNSQPFQCGQKIACMHTYYVEERLGAGLLPPLLRDRCVRGGCPRRLCLAAGAITHCHVILDPQEKRLPTHVNAHEFFRGSCIYM